MRVCAMLQFGKASHVHLPARPLWSLYARTRRQGCGLTADFLSVLVVLTSRVPLLALLLRASYVSTGAEASELAVPQAAQCMVPAVRGANGHKRGVRAGKCVCTGVDEGMRDPCVRVCLWTWQTMAHGSWVCASWQALWVLLVLAGVLR